MKQPNFLLPTAILLLLAFGCTPSKTETTSDPVEGKSLQNPVSPSAASLSSGKKLYDRLCADCHGSKGDGVSEIAANTSENVARPPDLTDDKWDHGSADGDIFVAIRDGVGGPAAMKGLNGRPGVGPTEMWHIVNYVRSLRPAP